MISLGWRLTLRGWKRLILVSFGLAVALLFYGYYQLNLAQIAEMTAGVLAPPALPGDTIVSYLRGVSRKEYDYDISTMTMITGCIPVAASSIDLAKQEISCTLLTFDMQDGLLQMQQAVKAGRLPESASEVCLTEKVAATNELALDDTLLQENGQKLSIVGILQPDSELPVSPFISGLVLLSHDASLERINTVFVSSEEGKAQSVMYKLYQKYNGRRDVSVYSLLSMQEMGIETRTLSEGLVSSMSTTLVLAVGAFLANMQLVGLMNKRKETQALKAVGLSLGQMYLFPVMDALWAAAVAVPFFLLGWQFVLPRFVTEAVGLSDPLVIRTLMLDVGVCLAAGVLAGAVNSRGQFSD